MELTVLESIKLLRQRAGLSQTEFGDLVGMSIGTIVRIESGRKSPSVSDLERIAQKLGVELIVKLAIPGPE